MESIIREAPKLYLDTNHLINIARLRNESGPVPLASRDAYRRIDDFIRNMPVGLLFNMAAPLDWVNGRQSLDGALELAEIIESADLQYEIELDTFLYLYEVIKEIERLDSSLLLPKFEVFYVRSSDANARRPILVLRNEVPDFFDPGELIETDLDIPSEISFQRITKYVERAWKLKTERPNVFKEKIDGFRAATERDMEEFGKRRKQEITLADKISWMKQRLKLDRILASLNPGVDVEAILHGIEICRCPATSLYLNAHERRLRNQSQPINDNDVDDWLYISVIPYSDVVLMERNLRDYVRQADAAVAAKTTADPNEAVTMLARWLSPQHATVGN